MSTSFDTNMGVLTDHPIIDNRQVEILTTEDNLLIIAVTQKGLKLFAKDWKEVFEKKFEEYEESGLDFKYFLNLSAFVDSMDSTSYMFRFSASSYLTMPSNLLTFSFDILRKDGNCFTASISNENNPIFALLEALMDLKIKQTDVSGLSVRVEYCGKTVFSSPKSLMKIVFKGKVK